MENLRSNKIYGYRDNISKTVYVYVKNFQRYHSRKYRLEHGEKVARLSVC